MRKLLSLLLVALAVGTSQSHAATQVRYTGTTLSNPYLHDGGLAPIIGTHNIQTMRANREQPDETNCQGWTYNHQPMMAYWHGRFWLHYLSDPISEHIPPSVTWLQTSTDGRQWTNPEIIFPEYQVPDGFRKEGQNREAKDMKAVMHQRVGWYVSSAKTGERLIAIAHYGICLHPKDDPNDGNGVGRVVREVYEDGTMGPIYFLYYNHNFNPSIRRSKGEDNNGKAYKTDFPLYKKSKDKKFIAACEEILNSPLYWMQMVEEADRMDSRLPLTNIYKAFCHYTLPDDTTIVALWKHALSSTSRDGGKTWSTPIGRSPGFVNSNAKIWGQRLTDGMYATVYNPAEFRWPLALSLSTDGLNYTTLNLVHGEITPMRYGGQYKSNGPQYVRGIQEGNGIPADSNLWVSYSVNKEDIWVARVPVPVRTTATRHAADDFSRDDAQTQLDQWNIYSPVWARVGIEEGKLTLRDQDPFDYAKAERIIPATRQLETSFSLSLDQIGNGSLQIEWLDSHGSPCSRLEWSGADSLMRVKVGARWNTILKTIQAGHTYEVKTLVDLDKRNITLWIDGKKYGPKMLFAPLESITRVCFRTGDRRSFPTPETPADRFTDLPDAGKVDPLAVWHIGHFHTNPSSTALQSQTPSTSQPLNQQPSRGSTPQFLRWQDYRHYVDYFNTMEPENIVQAIPNADAAAWMERNIPLFDCPDRQIEEMFYYRWWTLRKHIKETPVGYGMTEFLVNRSYADKYNLIACAVGHHIMESRWLRDTTYINQIVRTWLRGNDGKPMQRIDRFSSWIPTALLQQTAVTGDWRHIEDLTPDLIAHLRMWDETRLCPDSLYWQSDVKDGMEESISGGRKVKNRRPTINSYMWANHLSLARLLHHQGKHQEAAQYEARAEQLRQLIIDKLWHPQHAFFETMTEADTLADVREAIGYIPWYFNLPPDEEKYGTAWLQLLDTKGFSAPFGLTTAERRHPRFRKRGVGTCEWDGAIWPFATSQTLTALANYLNDYTVRPQLPDSLYLQQIKLYTESQYRRGRPYIGEYLDETNGQWLMGDRERSYYYNHSTYNDLIISGLVGIRPTTEAQITLHPLIPADSWDYFCLDGIAYHGHILTVIWDRDGSHYHQGAGLRLLIDGTLKAHRADLGKLQVKL